MLIQEFIEHYKREYDYYKEVARLCAFQCEQQLKLNGIKALVTYRAKQPDGLYKKLKQRNEKKNYKHLADIYKDLVDLAGVRIAIYFPDEFQKVEEIILRNFSNIEKKLFSITDTENGVTPKKEFSRYQAIHYRLNLKDNDNQYENSYDLTEKSSNKKTSFLDTRYCEARIEIQVASVLMHAWAEVEHDLVYKPYTGNLSEQEYSILARINDIVLKGQDALKELKSAMINRIEKEKRLFNDYYELAAYLSNAIGLDYDPSKDTPLLNSIEESSRILYKEKSNKIPAIGDSELLFEFLKELKLNTPGEVNKYLNQLDLEHSTPSITSQLITLITDDDPNLSKKFMEVKYKNFSQLLDINVQTLVWAASENKIKTLTALIQEGVDVNKPNDYAMTPIMAAVTKGQTDIVRLLLKSGANPNILDNGRTVPIVEAAYKGFTSVVRLLLEYGANPNLKSSSGWTALFAAKLNKNSEIANILESAGARDIDQR